MSRVANKAKTVFLKNDELASILEPAAPGEAAFTASKGDYPASACNALQRVRAALSLRGRRIGCPIRQVPPVRTRWGKVLTACERVGLGASAIWIHASDRVPLRQRVRRPVARQAIAGLGLACALVGERA